MLRLCSTLSSAPNFAAREISPTLQSSNLGRTRSVMTSTNTEPFRIGRGVRKPRQYAQGQFLVSMSPHIVRDTQAIALSRLGKKLFALPRWGYKRNVAHLGSRWRTSRSRWAYTCSGALGIAVQACCGRSRLRCRCISFGMRSVRLSLPRWSCLPAHVTYTCSSTLGIAVHSHQLPPIPSASPTLMHFTLSIAAQRLNEYRMAAERVPSITHTPSFDSDALYNAERTIQSISGQCSGGRSFAFANAFAEDCST